MLNLSRRIPCHTRQIYALFLPKAPFHSSYSVMRARRSGDDVDLDRPIKFTSSKAAGFNSSDAFLVKSRDVPPYQPYVVSVSVAVFLIYFLMLREENDIDEELNRTLYERVPGLEESQLKLSIKYNKKHGQPTEDMEKRLAEITTTERPAASH